MEILENRLVRCFQVIFPGLDEKQIRNATNTSLAGWDSIAMVTLINVIEEEFGAQIEVEDAESLTSFRRFLEYLGQRQNGSEPR